MRVSRWRGHASVVLVALILVAVNLRLGITTVAALLVPLGDAGALTPTIAVLVPSIPTAVFAIAGVGTARLASRIGNDRTLRWGMIALAAGLLIRVVPSPWVIVAGTVISTGGIAIVNILLPAIVRGRFGGRIGPVTTVYSTAMSLGAAAGAALAVPIAEWLGSPTLGLAAWAIPALIGLVAWTIAVPTTSPAQGAETVHAAEAIRSAEAKLPLPAGTWLLAAYFSMQSLVSYIVMGYLPAIAIDAGIPASRSGVLLGIAMAVGIPGTVVIVSFVRSAKLLRVGFVVVGVANGLGMMGLFVAPTLGPEIWAALLGIGMCVFPLVLAIIAGIGENARETARISALVQPLGYTVATLGPLTAGAVRQWTGSWDAVLIGVTVLIAVQCVIGLLLTRALARTKYA